MNPSEENIKNMYDYLSTMFNVSYEEFKSLNNGYRLISSEKPIEFFMLSDFSVFNGFNESAQYFKYYDHDIKVVNIELYISHIQVCLKYIQENIDLFKKKTKYTNKIDKYKKIISKYHSMFPHHHINEQKQQIGEKFIFGLEEQKEDSEFIRLMNGG